MRHDPTVKRFDGRLGSVLWCHDYGPVILVAPITDVKAGAIAF
jgi:hypothetical protein